MENNRILVVDDNKGIHHDFRKILMPSLAPAEGLSGLEERLFGNEAAAMQGIQHIEYQLDCASYAEQALEVFGEAYKRGEPYSVVFADVRMPPGEDGVKLIERIWALAPRTQVVIMTAFSDYTWEDLIERFGWSDRLIILRKPFDTITIKQLALMLTRRWYSEGALRAQRDELAALVREKDRAERKLARFREAMEQAGDAILMLHAETGEILDYNSTLCRLLKYEEQEMASVAVTHILEESDFSRWKDGDTLEEPLRCKDGSFVPVEISISYKPTVNRPTILAIIRDISRRVSAERERRHLETQLRHSQKMQTIGTLTSGIAHDFNNILSPIIVYTEMAIEDTTNHRIREDLEQVHKAAYRARDLVQHILNFSHQVEKERMPLKIHLVIKEVMHLVRASTPTTITINCEIPDCGLVMAGPTQIHQVLMNLCTNARQAMQHEGGELTVRLSRRVVELPHLGIQHGEYCMLSVRDSGSGIPKELHSKIFEPFFTTKGDEGTGLGLSMVNDIVKAHDGCVELISQEGDGTTFNIYLPVAQEEQDETSANWEQPAGGGERVLFVDDEDMIVRMMHELLGRYGYKTTSMTNSLEALACFEEDPNAFDVVITDHTMPNLVGLELARKMLAIRPNLPVILCTGFGESVSENICKKAGIGAYLLKPIVAREMVSAIERVVGKK